MKFSVITKQDFCKGSKIYCFAKPKIGTQITVLQPEIFNFGELISFDMFLKTMPVEFGNFQNISENITYD